MNRVSFSIQSRSSVMRRVIHDWDMSRMKVGMYPTLPLHCTEFTHAIPLSIAYLTLSTAFRIWEGKISADNRKQTYGFEI